MMEPSHVQLMPLRPRFIHGPIVVEEPNLEIHGYRLGAVTVHIRDQARRTIEEIAGIEVEDGGKPDFAPRRVDADVTMLLDEQMRCGVELTVQRVGPECCARKSGAAYYH